MSSSVCDQMLEHRNDEIAIEVDDRADMLKQHSQTMCFMVQCHARRELQKLSRNVRNMTLREFSDKYKGNVQTVENKTVLNMQKDLDSWVRNTPRLRRSARKKKYTMSASTRDIAVPIAGIPSAKTPRRSVRRSTRKTRHTSQANQKENAVQRSVRSSTRKRTQSSIQNGSNENNVYSSARKKKIVSHGYKTPRVVNSINKRVTRSMRKQHMMTLKMEDMSKMSLVDDEEGETPADLKKFQEHAKRKQQQTALQDMRDKIDAQLASMEMEDLL